MISGRSSETTYEQTEKRKPGKTSSVTAAPPRTCRRSSDEDGFAGPGEIGGGSQTVMAAANDNDVVAHRWKS